MNVILSSSVIEYRGSMGSCVIEHKAKFNNFHLNLRYLLPQL